MANWCKNMVAFEGNAEAIKQITELFKTMSEKEKRKNEGQLPTFMTKNRGYFFHIDWDEEDEGFFCYETKWSPNIEIIEKIAEHYKVNFTYDYEELGCLIFGRAIYKNGVLTDVFLDNADFDAFYCDEETDTYHFEGKSYESDYEILETLLERKIAKQIL